MPSPAPTAGTRGYCHLRLLGRRSYAWFTARWPSRRGELAERLNSMPKCVVSSSLEDPGMEQHDGAERQSGGGSLEAEAGVAGRHPRPRQLPARGHADGARPRRRAASDEPSRSCSGAGTAFSARSATSDPCASWPIRRSMATSPYQTTSASGSPDRRGRTRPHPTRVVDCSGSQARTRYDASAPAGSRHGVSPLACDHPLLA